MEERFTRRDLLNGAGFAGIVLAILPIVFYFLNCRVSSRVFADPEAPSAGGGWLILLWVVKLVGSILILRYFMRAFASRFPRVETSAVSGFGTLCCLASSLIFSAFILAYHKFIDPDMMRLMTDFVLEKSPMALDENTRATLEKLPSGYPVTAFFSNFFYCTLYGAIASAILSRRIAGDGLPPDSPNEDN